MPEIIQKQKSMVPAIFFILIMIVLVTGIFMWKNSRQPSLVGGDKDSYGCLISAGYSWCDARKGCERPWERYCTVATPKMAFFSCEGGKTITATFYPSDDKYVDLVLSDDRMLSVPRAISASGARYAKDDDSFVFWNKGETASVTENGVTTFTECVAKVE